MASKPPPEERSRGRHESAAAQALEGCSPEPAGRPLEAPGDGVSRWMVAAAPPLLTPRRRGTESGLQANSPAPDGQHVVARHRPLRIYQYIRPASKQGP